MATSTEELLALLRETPDDADTVARLDAALVEAGMWSELVAELPAAARGLSDAAQRGRFLIHAAWCASSRLEASDTAQSLFQEVVDLDLPDDSLLSAFQQAFAPQQAWSDQAMALQEFARVTPSDALQGKLLFAAGRVLEDRLFDHPGAIKAYQLSFRMYPLVPDALRAARAIYAQGDEWATVAKLYTYELRIPLDERAKARVWKELGQVQLHRLGDNEGALASFQEAMALDPDLIGLQNVIAQITGEPVDSVELEPADEAQPGDDSSSVEVELEPVSAEDDQSEAAAEEAVVDASVEDVETDEAESEEAVEESEVVASEESVEEDAAEEAVEEDAEADAPEETVEESEVVASEESVEEDAAEEAVNEDAEADASEETVDEDAEADSSDETVEAEADASEESVEESEVVASEESVEESEVDASEESVEEAEAVASEDAVEDADSEESVAEELSEETVADVEDAESETPVDDEEVAAAAPDEAEPGSDADASDESTSEDNASTPTEMTPQEAAIAARAARAASRTTGGSTLSSTITARSGEPASATGESGLVASERWTLWLESLIDQASGASAAESVALYALALEYGRKLGTPDDTLVSWVMQSLEASENGRCTIQEIFPGLYGALSVWQRVAEELTPLAEGDPVYAGALYAVSFYALADVEAASRLAPDADEWASVEQSVLELAAKGNWRKTQQGLQDALPSERSSEAEAYRAQAWVALGLGQEDKAIDSMRRVLRADKQDANAAFVLRNLYLTAGKTNELAALLKTAVGLVSDDERELKSLLLRQQLYLYQEVLQQDPLVVTTYQALADVDPDDIEVLDALSGKLRELGRFPDLIDTLKKKADAVTEDADRMALLMEVADLYVEKFNNQNEAIKAWESVIEIDAGNEAALRSLEDGYDKRRMWDELISIKRRLVELTYDPAAQAGLLREAADVAATRKRDLPLSVELWNEVLEVVPGDADALAALEQIYERDKQWEELADVLQQRVELLSDPAERGAALLKLGMVAGDKLNQTERALDAWSSLLELEPENFRARDAVRKALVELERWDDLESFYASDGSWAEYVRQLESLAGSVDSDELKIDLLRRAADVWSKQLEDEGRAVKNLEKILSLDADDVGAAGQLAPHYRARGDFKRLAPVLEVLLGRSEASEERYALRVELARGHMEKSRDAGAAVHWYGEALSEEPWHVDILDELEEAAAAAEAPNELESILEDARSVLSTMPEYDDAWLNLSLRMGALLDMNLGRSEDALVYYDDVLMRAPENVDALDAKDNIFTRLGLWDDLLDVVAAKMERAHTSAERVALLERMSVIHEDSRDDFASAIVTWKEILAIEPEREAAFSALRRLYRATDDFESLASILREQSALHPRQVDEARWLDQVLLLADVLVEPLQQFDEALSLLEEAVAASPSNGKARGLLEHALQDPEHEVRAARILAPLYEADEAWPGFVGMLEILAASLDDEAEKATVLRRLGAVQDDQLGDPVKASDAYARLLRVDVFDDHAAERLQALAGQIDGWSELTSLYEELADESAYAGEASAARAVELLTRASVFSDQELNDLDEAIRLSRRILEVVPAHQATLVRLDDLLSRGERYDELLTNCQDRLAVAEGSSERRSLLLQAALLHEEHLDDPASAIDAYQQILGLDAEDSEALSALDRLYGQTGDAMNQALILESRAGLQPEGSESQLDLLNRLADIQEHDLGDVASSIEVRRRILAAAPDNGPAQERLEALLENEDYAAQSASILEPIYVANDDHAALVRLLEVMLTAQTDPLARRESFSRLIRIQRTALDDRAAAYDVVERALVEFLGDAEFTETALSLAESLDAWSSLCEHLEHLADDAMDPVVQRDTLALVADLRDTRLGDAESAVGLWERVVDANPQDMAALEALEQLHTRTEAWAPLVETLLRKTEHPDVMADQSMRVSLMFRAASLYEDRLDEPSEAINLLLAVLSIDPSNSGAIEQLERLYTRTEAWEDLVENYHRKLTLATDADERRELHFAMGRVLESELDDPDRAIEAYRTVVAERQDDLGALSALDRLYLQTENWHELLDVLRAEAGIIDDVVQAHALKIRIGRLLESELMMPMDAVAVYGEVLGEDVSNHEAREALMGLARRGEETSAIYRLLEPVYRTEGAWGELIELSGRLVEVTDSAEDRRALHADEARIHENELGSQADAWVSWSNVVREGLRLEDMEQICRLAEPLERWAETVELLEEMWDQESDPSLRTAVGLRIAAAWRDKLDSPGKAIEAYTRVYDEDMSETSALLALDGLYSSTEQWGMLSEVLGKRIMVPGVSSDEATSLRLRLAALYLDALDAPMDAVATYREVLAADSGNESAIRALEALAEQGVETSEIALILEPEFRASQSWGRLVGLHEARIRQEDSNDERYRLWLDVASIYEQELSDRVSALTAVGNALVELPSDGALKDRLAGLAEETGEWHALAGIYENLLRQDLDDAERFDASMRLAEVLGGRLSDVVGAESAYASALEVEPSNEQALKAMDELLTAREAWPELSDILARLREVVFNPPDLAALTYRHARIHEERLLDNDAAINALQDVLDIDPTHVDAMGRLLSLYERTERWSDLYEALERKADMQSDEELRSAVLEEMAGLATSRLDRIDDAIDLWRRVAESRGLRDWASLQQLAALYRQTEQSNELADTIDRLVEVAPDDITRAELLQESGYLWAEVLDNQGMAIERYARILEIIEDEPNALISLRSLYERSAQYEQYVSTVERLLSLTLIEAAELPAVYEQVAEIQTDILGDHDKAIAAWNRLLGVVPGHLNALERLDQLHSQRSEWRPLVDVLEQRLQTMEEDADRIDLLKRIAGIWHHEIKETEPAIEAYNRVLDLDLFDFDAGSSYEQLLTSLERWDELVGYYLDRADGLSDEFERRMERQKAASLYENKLERPDAAFLVMVSAGQEAPLDEELHAEMMRLADASGQHAVLADSFSRMLAAVSDSADLDQTALLPLLLALGLTHNDSLGRPEMAEPYYARALELDAENERALTALESIYERTDDPEMLVGILKRRAGLAYDAREQTSLYNRIGALYRDALENLEEATEAFKMSVRIDDTDATALDALESIYTSTSQWRALVEVLETKASSVFDSEPLRALRFRIATTWHNELKNADRAIEAYKDVLSVVPGDIESLSALELLYASGEQWERYLDVMDDRLNLSSDVAERAEFLFKQARVYEAALDDVDRAVDCLNMVLGENPSSLEAIEELERLYNENERPADLVEIYERHVAAVEDDEAKAAVLAAMGRTWAEELGDVYRAADTYQRILQFDPVHLVALERLGVVYEEIGDAPKAIEMYERLAEASPVQSVQAEKLFRAGELYEVEQGDLETATARYLAVLDIDPTFVRAMQAMQRVYMTSERWVDAIEMIERQFDFNRDLASRAMLLVTIGAINEEHLANHPAAQRRYEEALELDPANIYAAEPLSRMFYEAGEWERARSTLELLVNSEDYPKDDAVMAELFTRLGRVNEELASDDEAQRWYEKTRHLSAASPQALQGLARILRRAGSLQEACALNLEIVSSYRSTLTTEMYAELTYQCGDIKAELGEINEARILFEQVLEVDPQHIATLKRLMLLCEESDDQVRLAEVRQRLFEVTDDPTLRLTLITQVGDAWLAAGDIEQAEHAFREAVRLDPDSKLVLTKLLNVFVAGEKWERACEVLGKLSQVETDPARQSQYFFTIGSLFRDQMSKPSEALEFFNKALDIDPMNLAPFEAIDKLVTEARDWNTQQREYRKMLARVVSVDSEAAVNLRFVLLKNLGEIYRTRMQDMPRAIDSYRAAFTMNPGDEQVANVLAELYERTGDNGPEVIELHQRLIDLSLSRFDSYHALFKAFLSTREFDKAWCVSAALTLFSKQTPEQEAYYKRYLTPQIQQARRSVSDDLWVRLVHPDADPDISRIFATIANGIREDYAQDFKRWHVNKRRDRIDSTQPMPLTAMLRYSFERIGVAPMAIYATQAYPGLYNANLDPPGIVAGPDMLSGKTERELAFICSKTVALCRPEYYLGSGFNTTDSLKVFFYAAIALVTGNVIGDAPVDVVRGYVDALMRMPEPVLAQLRNQVTTYLNQGRNPDLSAWLRGIDHTASRVGLLFCGDVRAAAECIRNEPAPIGKEKQKDRLVELVKFALSDDYFTLRKELGLALQA